MSELSELYQEVILDHNKQPRNFHKMEAPDRQAEGYNPLCGDQLSVYLKMQGDKIEDISFLGSGCAISKASGSMMTASVKGKTEREVEALFEKFHQMVTGKPHAEAPEGLGKLAVFSGVCEFPSRVKCASLAWHTLRSALSGKEETISTEEEEAGDDDAHR
ncbi:MAG TPA: SUF system NifU family Fe-S cluster assembly protein [Deltaproteobacteria bacterium]|nr:SUF system NifU family Fe-S cluster assembly protein [Deltaproteobacteria bacterium]